MSLTSPVSAPGVEIKTKDVNIRFAARRMFMPVYPFIFIINTTNTSTGSTISNKFKLPLCSNGNYNFVVSWGDGSKNRILSWDDPATEHTYTESGNYTIKINGQCSRFAFSGVGDRLKLTKIQKWGQIGLTSMAEAFWGCANLIITATDHEDARFHTITDFYNAFRDCASLTKPFPTLDTSNVLNFAGTWYGCTGLTEFPALNTSKAITLQGTWQKCSNLTSFPWISTSAVKNFNGTWYDCFKIDGKFPDIDTSEGTNFNSTWRTCKKITEFDANLNTSKAATVLDCWNGCESLTKFPSINLSNATELKAAWYNCKNLAQFPHITLLSDPTKSVSLQQTWSGCTILAAFPSGIDTSRVTQFSAAWHACPTLTTFPWIDTSKGIDFSNTWKGCTHLTSFPLLDTSNGTNFNFTWLQCYGLSGVMPTQDMRAMTTGVSCFPTLSTAIYNSILDQLANGRGAIPANPNNNVPLDASSSRYNTTTGGYNGTVAKATLIHVSRGWSITDGGELV